MSLSPNDSYLYEKIIHQVGGTIGSSLPPPLIDLKRERVGENRTVLYEEEQPSVSLKVLPVLVQAGVGVAAGTAIGFFFIPTMSLVACGIVGGLGLYTATNTIQSIRSAWSSPEPLTVSTPITPKSPVISSREKD